jgi:hypothetical protein
MTQYNVIELEGLDEMQTQIVNAVIHEGEMRQTEKVIALLERKMVEEYQDKEKVNFYYNLIAEIESL